MSVNVLKDTVDTAYMVTSWYAENTTGFSLVLAILVFVIGALVDKFSKKDVNLERLLIKTIAASTLPTSVLVIMAGFFPSLIAKVNEARVLFTIIGLVVTYFTLKEIFKQDR